MSTVTRSESRGSRRQFPVAVWLYLVGALGLGASAVFGGSQLLLDPSGGSLGLPVEWLVGTPFATYLEPGAILLVVLGLGSFGVIVGTLRRASWAWPASVGLGVALVGWIAIQMLLLQRVHLLHAIYGGLGLFLLVVATRRSFRTAVSE